MLETRSTLYGIEKVAEQLFREYDVSKKRGAMEKDTVTLKMRTALIYLDKGAFYLAFKPIIWKKIRAVAEKAGKDAIEYIEDMVFLPKDEESIQDAAVEEFLKILSEEDEAV